MSVEIQFEYRGPGGTGGVELFSASVESLSGRLSDWTPFFEEASDLFESEVQQQFASQGSHFGTSWEPIKDRTHRERGERQERGRKMQTIRRSKGQRILPLSGRTTPEHSGERLALVGGPLEASFTSGGKGHVEDITPESLVWGSELMVDRTGVVLARVHHFGAPSRNLPSRPILILTVDMQDKLESMAQGFIGKVVEDTGWGGEQLSLLSGNTGWAGLSQ